MKVLDGVLVLAIQDVNTDKHKKTVHENYLSFKLFGEKKEADAHHSFHLLFASYVPAPAAA
jgi:hypothetical protein